MSPGGAIPAFLDEDLVALVRDGSPAALAQAVQYRTTAALRLLSLRSLVAALRAPEELGEDARTRLLLEVALRLALDARRRLDAHPAAVGHLAAACGSQDPFLTELGAAAASASRGPGGGEAPPAPDPGEANSPSGSEDIARVEADWLAALARVGESGSRLRTAAVRAAERLAFGHERTIAPVVTTLRPARRGLLPGHVVRLAIDPRAASPDPSAVVLRRDGRCGRRFREAATQAQRLAMDVTGDRRHFGVSLADADLPARVDGPSCGLAVFAATALALLHRNPPPAWIGFAGAFDGEGRLVPAGETRRKVRAAAAGGLRALVLPEACRDEVLGLETPLALVFLPPLSRTALLERIEREVAALAPDFLRVREADARRIYARGEELFVSGRPEAEPELRYLARALEGHAGTDALASLGAAAEARLGRCCSRRGDVVAAAAAFERAERRLHALAEERRLEREGREVLAEFGVWRAITLIDMRDFPGAEAAALSSLSWKAKDAYTSRHSLARTHGALGIVRYSWARTLPPGPERERLFGLAEADVLRNLEMIQPFDRGRVLGYRATLDLYRGRLGAAEEGFRHVLQAEVGREGSRAVNHRWALDGLAHTLFERGAPGGERAVLEEAVRVASTPTDPGIDREIPGRLQRWRGAALRELGRFSEGREALGRALRLLLTPWPAGHPKRALAVPAALEMALLEARAGDGDAAHAAARDALALLDELEATPSLGEHFAPTRASVAFWRDAGGPSSTEPMAGSDLAKAIRRLLP